MMDTMEAIHTRRSIREYQDKPVPKELITELLKAAMAAPSAGNQQPWAFIVIDDPDILKEAPTINPFAEMAYDAPLGILVCGDLDGKRFPDYWGVDCSAAVQNLLLAAHALGLGAVWTGVYPREERMDGFAQLLALPEHIQPHTLVVIGYPEEIPERQDRYTEEKVHYNGW
jgi:nitroreductase